MDINVTGHTKFYYSIVFFIVDIMYFGEKVECGAEQNEGMQVDKKVVLVNKEVT